MYRCKCFSSMNFMKQQSSHIQVKSIFVIPEIIYQDFYVSLRRYTISLNSISSHFCLRFLALKPRQKEFRSIFCVMFFSSFSLYNYIHGTNASKGGWDKEIENKVYKYLTSLKQKEIKGPQIKCLFCFSIIEQKESNLDFPILFLSLYILTSSLHVLVLTTSKIFYTLLINLQPYKVGFIIFIYRLRNQ